MQSLPEWKVDLNKNSYSIQYGKLRYTVYFEKVNEDAIEVSFEFLGVEVPELKLVDLEKLGVAIVEIILDKITTIDKRVIIYYSCFSEEDDKEGVRGRKRESLFERWFKASQNNSEWHKRSVIDKSDKPVFYGILALKCDYSEAEFNTIVESLVN